MKLHSRDSKLMMNKHSTMVDTGGSNQREKRTDIIGQRSTLPEDISSMAEEKRTHPSVAWKGEGVLLVHGFEITKDDIDDTRGRFQVRASLTVCRTCDGVSAGDGLEHCFVGFITGALSLGRKV